MIEEPPPNLQGIVTSDLPSHNKIRMKVDPICTATKEVRSFKEALRETTQSSCPTTSISSGIGCFEKLVEEILTPPVINFDVKRQEPTLKIADWEDCWW